LVIIGILGNVFEDKFEKFADNVRSSFDNDSMRERTNIKMKATSVSDEQADIYTKLNKTEAIKDLANNSSNAGTSIMGMNMGNTFAGMLSEDEKK